jgi:two-component system nitrate/nitrite response regulator NarL
MRSAERVTVFIADDHPVFVEAVSAAIIGTALELVGTAEDGITARTEIERLRPDVAVLDVEMPGMSGRALAAWIAAEQLPTHVLFLSADRSGATIYDALAAGGYGYITKDMPLGDIRAAIMRVAEGNRVLGPELDGQVIEEIQERADRLALKLTEREAQVLRLSMTGASVAGMAEEMRLSPATVKAHLSTLYAKLGVGDRAGAIAEAMRRGLIT